MQVRQIKIDFFVTPTIKRYVYVYLLSDEEGCYLIDSGVGRRITQTIRSKGILLLRKSDYKNKASS